MMVKGVPSSGLAADLGQGLAQEIIHLAQLINGLPEQAGDFLITGLGCDIGPLDILGPMAVIMLNPMWQKNPQFFDFGHYLTPGCSPGPSG